MHRFTILLALAALAACDAAPTLDRDASGDAGAAMPDSAYTHRFLVLTASVDSPVAVVVELGATPGRDRLLRTAHAWIGSGSGWERALSREWSGTPLEHPARLVPGGGVRLLIGDAGALEGLILQTVVPALRISVDGVPVEDAPGEEVPVVLRPATLAFGNVDLSGALLHLTRARDATPSGPPDTTAGAPSLLLLSEDGDYLGVDGATGTATGIGKLAGLDGTLRVERAATPAAWRVLRGTTAIGTLERIADGWSTTMRPGPDPPITGLHGVRGTLRVGGDELTVVGALIEPGAL